MPDPVEADDLRIVPANHATWEDLEAVFGTADYPFHCQCQRFKVTGWLWRDTSLEARLAMQRAGAACGEPGAKHSSGLVAYLEEEPVGWVAVGRVPPTRSCAPSGCRGPDATRTRMTMASGR